MQSRFGAYFLFALAAAPITSASAGPLPSIKAGPGNSVPECVTPGRLLAFLKSRNPSLEARFEGLPSEYMRWGETLGVRWDYAFFQMLVETGGLSFRNGGRAGSGDVKPAQNNFAGIGATGKGEPGESFGDIPTGVRAHLEHLLLYSGERLESPVADRTRKVQQWGVLANWQAGFTKPITYADLAQKWAPGSATYSKSLDQLAQSFQDFCRRPDPKPDLLAAVRKSRQNQVAELMPPPAERPDGRTLARRAVEDGKVEENNRRLGLGAQEPTPNLGKTPPTPFKIVNAPPPPAAEPEPPAQPSARVQAPPPPAANPGTPSFRSGMLNVPAKQQQPPAVQPEPVAMPPAAAPPAAQPPASPPPAARKEQPNQRVAMVPSPPATKPVAISDAVPPGQKCRVWTASYGGQKALIIRSVIDKVINFTVLDVNDGAEKREADAFIAAYAKNGNITGEFTNQNVALDKAFELCPEG